ncbi:MAG TPA: ATP-binding protein [Actinocrinis sp.]|uniref:ATP-binding protein n=1 Tax=Actinocrinis sp. TaxID=1920516 RepID=UPI002DDCEB5E|nr:ATP-binding protein [Actinocrinis sp.]HEV3172238.1 ATP-binding protein [Actinocrinis sp.]
MTGVHAADSLTPLESEPGGQAQETSPGPQVAPEHSGAPVVLRFAPLPEHVRTARLVAVALARRAGVEDGLLDEVRLAVGEACSRAVGLHRAAAPDVPVVVHLDDGRERFGVEVVDAVSGGPVPKAEDSGSEVREQQQEQGQEEEASADKSADDAGLGDDGDGAEMGLAVLRGLVDDLEVRLTTQGGVIRMGWPVDGPRFAS